MGDRQFVGISAEGKLMKFMHNGRLIIKNLDNIRVFGPSVATLQEWMTSAESARLLAQHAQALSTWPLLWYSWTPTLPCSPLSVCLSPFVRAHESCTVASLARATV